MNANSSKRALGMLLGIDPVYKVTLHKTALNGEDQSDVQVDVHGGGKLIDLWRCLGWFREGSSRRVCEVNLSTEQ